MAQSIPVSSGHLISLDDAILDSPVFRANVKHFEDQVELLERWLEGLMKELKRYVDELIRFNTQTMELSKKMTPHNIEIIDPNITLLVIRSFTEALQSKLAFQVKLANDIHDQLLSPLQEFIKNDLKDFKEAKRNYDRSLSSFESLLYRFASASKLKEPSALREDAFQLWETRKSYVKGCTDYTLRIAAFRSTLDSMLSEHFLGCMQSDEEASEAGFEVWRALRLTISEVRGILQENKSAAELSLSKLRNTQLSLVDTAIASSRPQRTLNTYSSTSQNPSTNPSLALSIAPTLLVPPSKQGYLYTRTTIGKPARFTWLRRWFYIQSGWFGSLINGTSGKDRHSVQPGERVPVLLCEVKTAQSQLVAEQDRRYCFEVVCASPPSSFLVQAETEEEFAEWTAIFESAKRFIVDNAKTTDKSGGDFQLDGKISDEVKQNDDSTEEPLNVSRGRPTSILLNQDSAGIGATTSVSPKRHTMHRSASSLATIMMEEATKRDTNRQSSSNLASTTNGSTNNQAGVWGLNWTQIPASLTQIPGLNALMGAISENSVETDSSQNSNISTSPSTSSSSLSLTSSGFRRQSIPSLPTTTTTLVSATSHATLSGASDVAGVLQGIVALDEESRKVDIKGYDRELQGYNAEIRKIWGAGMVLHDEIVLDCFLASLLQHPPYDIPRNAVAKDDDTTATVLEGSQLADAYRYTGRAYATQEGLWFYGSVVGTEVKSFAIKWHDVKEVKVDKDGDKEVIAVEGRELEKFIFRVLFQDSRVILQRLIILLANVRSYEPRNMQQLYDAVRAIQPSDSSSDVPELPKSSNQQRPKISRQSKLESKILGTNTVENGTEHPAYQTTSKPKSQSVDSKDEKIAANVIPDPKTTEINSDDTLPPSIPVPTKPVSCNCDDHLEKKESEIELPVSAKRLFTMMFGDEKESFAVWDVMNRKKGNWDVNVTPWGANKTRDVTYMMPINNSMVKIKETDVVDTQTIITENDYLNYSVLVSSKANGLPYGDAFLPKLKYCITYVTNTTCKLQIFIGIQWFKSPMVKSIISKATMAGMTQTATTIVSTLQDMAKPTQSTTDKAVARKKSNRKSHRATPSIHEEKLELQLETSPINKEPIIHAHQTKEEPQTDGPFAIIKQLYRIVTGIIDSVFNLGEGFIDLIPLEKRMVVAILLSISMITNFWAGVWSGNRGRADDRTGIVSTFNKDYEMVVARAVYIKDLNEGIISPVDDFMTRAESYQLFLQSRSLWRPRLHPLNLTATWADTQPTSPQPAAHTWNTSYHRLFAKELAYSRERVAILRHDVLLTFHQLNHVEARLLESEYINWLMDIRSHCLVNGKNNYSGTGKKNSSRASKLVIDKNKEVEVVGGVVHCYEIEEQLEHLGLYSSI